MQVALADLADRQQRVEIDERRHLAAGHDGAAVLDGHAIDDAVERRVYFVCGKLGLARSASCALAAASCGARLVGLQLRRVAALDQPLGRIGLRLALGNEDLGHLDGRFLVLGVEPHDEIALVDVVALADRKLLDDAHDADRQRRALVRLGLAGNTDRPRMLDMRRRHHGDGADRRFRLLGLSRLAGVLGRGASHRRKLAGSHPGGKADQDNERDELVELQSRHDRICPVLGRRLHPDVSFFGAPRMWAFTKPCSTRAHVHASKWRLLQQQYGAK